MDGGWLDVSTCLGPEAKLFGQTLFWMFLSCFWMRLTFKLGDSE